MILAMKGKLQYTDLHWDMSQDLEAWLLCVLQMDFFENLGGDTTVPDTEHGTSHLSVQLWEVCRKVLLRRDEKFT